MAVYSLTNKCASFRGIRRGSPQDRAGFEVDMADPVVQSYIARGRLARVPDPPAPPAAPEPEAPAPAPAPTTE